MTRVSLMIAAAVAIIVTSTGVANAQPLPDVPDVPGVDETFALNYGLDHQREICSILDYRFAEPAPAIHPIESIINEVSARGGFNYDTAAFAVGVAMGSSCPQHIGAFEDALGIEIA